KGEINLDVRNSKPDWDSFLDTKARKDAPNVLVILYDDTGCAAWSPYGGRINMPTMDRLAVAHDVGVFADALVPADRTEPPSERVRHDRRIGGGIPWICRSYPARERDHRDGAATGGLEYVLGRQEPQRARRCVRHRRQPRILAARSRLRSVLRLH